MAIADAQRRTGYIYGVKGIVVEVLGADGSAVTPTPTRYGMDTPQSVKIEPEQEDGESSVLRGGGKVLTRIKEVNTIVGQTLTITDAKFDIEGTLHLCGGTLIEETIETVDYNTGWEAPTIEEQQTRTPCKIEVYAENYNAGGSRDSYIKYSFYYGIGYASGVELNDQEWSTPEIVIDCQENNAQSTSTYHKEFVDSLPAEL